MKRGLRETTDMVRSEIDIPDPRRDVQRAWADVKSNVRMPELGEPAPEDLATEDITAPNADLQPDPEPRRDADYSSSETADEPSSKSDSQA